MLIGAQNNLYVWEKCSIAVDLASLFCYMRGGLCYFEAMVKQSTYAQRYFLYIISALFHGCSSWTQISNFGSTVKVTDVF